MFSKRWWTRTTERAVKTLAQTFVMLVGTDMAGWAQLDTTFIMRTMAIMGLLSVASSVITSKWTDDDSDPSAVS